MKVIIKYSRHGAVKYTSHLDMQRAFGRAVRRAMLPVEYSHGYNPHIVMSFASPLSVGYETEGDYLELSLIQEEIPENLVEAFNAVLPPQLQVLEIHAAPVGKKLMAQNESASYRIKFHFKNKEDCDKIKDAVQRLWAKEQHIAKDRRGRDVDIRPLILDAAMEDSILEVLLKNSSSGALNPAVVASALFEETGIEAEYEVCRKDCYTVVDGKRVPLSQL